jgi:ATP-dependent Lon protease
MDAALFGQQDAKDEVIKLVCQWACSGSTNSFAIGLEGAPGIGKTTFAKRALAAAINRPFVFIGLGGASDASFLVGHSYTYEGAIPGRLADALRESKVSDPVICIDELDKISKGPKGDEIVNVLIHLTDREQNSHFRDKYFHGIDIDLSRAIFVFSFNDARQISPILLDRLNIIHMKTPSVNEKVTICKSHLIPRAIKAATYAGNEFVNFSNEAIKYIVEKYTNEFGVRDLDRHIIHIVNSLNVYIHGGPECLPNMKLDLPLSCKKVDCSTKIISSMLGAIQTESSHSMMYM